ncbi:MAG: hypothetical protein ACOC0J_00110, partial [Myxococcota bacterium]
MSERKGLSIRQRLGVGFLLLLVVLATVSAVAIYWQAASGRSQEYYLTQVWPKLESASLLEQAVLGLAAAARSYLVDPGEEAEARYDRRKARMRSALQSFASLHPPASDDRLQQRILSQCEVFLVRAGELKSAPDADSAAEHQGRMLEVRERIMDDVARYEEQRSVEADQAMAAMESVRDRAALSIAVASAL